MREYIKEKVWWYIYIIELKGKLRYGHNQEYYTGITQKIGRRLGDYLYSRGKGYINVQAKDSIKRPVFVKYFYGNEYEAITVEKKIKHYSVKKKEELIDSDENVLIGYKPLSHLILKKNGSDCEIKIDIY